MPVTRDDYFVSSMMCIAEAGLHEDVVKSAIANGAHPKTMLYSARAIDANIQAAIHAGEWLDAMVASYGLLR